MLYLVDKARVSTRVNEDGILSATNSNLNAVMEPNKGPSSISMLFYKKDDLLSVVCHHPSATHLLITRDTETRI